MTALDALPKRYAALFVLVPLCAAAGYHNRATMPPNYKLPWCWNAVDGWGFKKTPEGAKGASCPIGGK
jgi:hypothetical protein